MCTFGAPWDKKSTERCKTPPTVYDSRANSANSANSGNGTTGTAGYVDRGVALIWEERACTECNYTGLHTYQEKGQVYEETITTHGQWFGGKDRHLFIRSRPTFWRDVEAWRMSMAVGLVPHSPTQDKCNDNEGQWVQLSR